MFFFLGQNSNANKLGKKKKISRAQDLDLAKLGSNLVLPHVYNEQLFNFFASQLFSTCKMANMVQRFSVVIMISDASRTLADL